MFNRGFIIKPAPKTKTTDPEIEAEPKPSFQDFVTTTREGLKDVAIATIAGIAVYVVLDTARQVIVNNTNPNK